MRVIYIAKVEFWPFLRERITEPFRVRYKEDGRWHLPPQEYAELSDAIDVARKHRESLVVSSTDVVVYSKTSKAKWVPILRE